MNNVDTQYLDALYDIYHHGYEKDTRSGKTRSLFGKTMKFDMNNGFPLLTTKKMFTKGIIHELLWFLKGDTNIKYLVDNGVHIWDDDAYRYYKTLIEEHNEISKKYSGIPYGGKPCSKEEFLRNVSYCECLNLSIMDNYNCPRRLNYWFGDLGPVYGKQWRMFGHEGIDQIQNIIDTLKKNPDDRRMLCVAYNPEMIDKMALPPCHVMFQVYSRKLSEYDRKQHIREDGTIPERALSLMFMCRSQDFPLGTPYNIASYALLLEMIAHCTGMVADELVYVGGDCHIYENQLEGVSEQLTRDPEKYSLPKLWLNPKVKNIFDFTYEDIKIEGYQSYDTIHFPLSVG